MGIMQSPMLEVRLKFKHQKKVGRVIIRTLGAEWFGPAGIYNSG